MKIVEVFDVKTQEFTHAMKIYCASFPSNALQPVSLIKARFEEKKYRLFVGYYDQEITAFALVYKMNNPKFLLLDYFAVAPSFRGRFFGTEFLKVLFNELGLYNSQKQIYLLFEVDDPNYGQDVKEQIKRINFYRFLGVKTIKDVHYILPPLDGTYPTDMVLMIFPLPSEHTLARENLAQLIQELYIEKYLQKSTHMLLKKILLSIPRNIEIE